MNYDLLISSLADVHQRAQAGAAGAVNRHLILRNWLIGAYLVEFEQNGEDRAQYGRRLLQKVSADLRQRQISGCSPDTLERCRLFYLTYPQVAEAISAPLLRKLPAHPNAAAETTSLISAPLVRKSEAKQPTPLPVEKILTLSWTHLLELIRLDDPWKRAFYENECLKGNWSKRQLQRKIASLLYERTGLSTDKHAVIERARQQAAEAPAAIADLIRDPYVLEFTGLAEKPRCLERDLETALLDHLQAFLLELGTGFCFEARQKRITIGNEHDYIDLVFYHRLLRCHLLIDLKLRAFQHGDAGQIHPVRYHAKSVLLRLCAPKSQRRDALHRIHKRSSSPRRRASCRCCSLHSRSATARTCLLRGMSFTSRRHQAREVSENSVGQALHQRSHRCLSNGVNYYLSYWKDQIMQPGDQPPVGLLLCTDKNETKVEYATAGLDHQLFVSRYLVALPKPEQFLELIENDRAAWEQHHTSLPTKE